MDISVKHLNGRMAEQIPTEFPLGLVLVVGEVALGSLPEREEGVSEFYLKEDDNHLLCRLTASAAKDSKLNDGDLIRAGGHIIFDRATARYYLFARHFEVLKEHKPPSSTLEDIVSVSSQKTPAELSPSILPQWVRELAPPEIQEEWAARRIAEAGGTLVLTGETPAQDEEEEAPEPVAAENWQELVSDDASMDYTAAEPPLSELSDELIEFLSEAIDSKDIVELTPGMLADFVPEELETGETEVVDDEDSDAPPEEQESVASADDARQAKTTKETSVEEFLTALETAIAADEALLKERSKEEELESEETAPESAVSIDGEQVEAPSVQEPEPTGDADVQQPAQDMRQLQPQPVSRRVEDSPTPWYIYFLVVLAVLLLLAIIVVLVVGSGLFA
jgi:hypothetical protein